MLASSALSLVQPASLLINCSCLGCRYKDAIAFIVMFRSRFSDVFAKSLPHYGPQDIERGVSGDLPDENAERLLCAFLDLCLNRKKPVE